MIKLELEYSKGVANMAARRNDLEAWDITECLIKEEPFFDDNRETNLIAASWINVMLDDIMIDSQKSILDMDRDFKLVLANNLLSTL